MRNRIVQLFRQRSDTYKNLAQSGMATRARFSSSLNTPTRLASSVLAVRTLMLDGTDSVCFFFCEQVKDSVDLGRGVAAFDLCIQTDRALQET